MVRKLVVLGTALMVVGWNVRVFAQEAPPAKTEKPATAFRYVGATKCKLCHNTEAQGRQFTIWQNSKHSKAYELLASDTAKQIAAKLNIADPQKSEKCLRCHVTGYEAPAEQKLDSYAIAEGVSCESCHGPGDKYRAPTVMKDKNLALQNGLVLPDEKTCIKCHNKDNPTYKEFKFTEAVKLIAHPKPKK